MPMIFLFYLLPCDNQAINDSIVRVKVKGLAVSAGEKKEVTVLVSVKKAYHIQANKVDDEFIIPTTLEIDTHGILIAKEPVFPESKKFRLQGTSDYLLVYDGHFRITVPFKTVENVKKGTYNLPAKLHYQACDNRTCFAPKTITFSITVKVV